MSTRRFALLAGLGMGVAALGAAWPTPVDAQLPASGPPPFIPTPDTLVAEMLRLARVTPEDLVVDLGSGDGRLVIAAGAAGARGIGVDYDPALVEVSRANARAAGVAGRVRFVHADIFQTDVSEASVVMLYLSAEFNLRLRPRLLEQLRPGSRIVSHAFHMGDWEPDSAVTIGSGAGRATLFSWIVPANMDGFWSLEIEGREPLVLEFRQSYQQLEAVASRSGRPLPGGVGRIRGEEVQFVLADPDASAGGQDLLFIGRLADDALSGLLSGTASATAPSWRAVRFTDIRFRPETPIQR